MSVKCAGTSSEPDDSLTKKMGTQGTRTRSRSCRIDRDFLYLLVKRVVIEPVARIRRLRRVGTSSGRIHDATQRLRPAPPGPSEDCAEAHVRQPVSDGREHARKPAIRCRASNGGPPAAQSTTG